MSDNEEFYSPPRWLIVLTIICFIAILLFGCKAKTVYVPVESVKTEYKNNYLYDSIHHYDSIYVKEKGDTLIFEKYKYLYKDRYKTDTIVRTDSIQVPYPVEVEKEVNRLTSIQSFQIWCGRIVLLLLLSWLAIKYIRRFV